jgi:hypothetical protein
MEAFIMYILSLRHYNSSLLLNYFMASYWLVIDGVAHNNFLIGTPTKLAKRCMGLSMNAVSPPCQIEYEMIAREHKPARLPNCLKP